MCKAPFSRRHGRGVVRGAGREKGKHEVLERTGGPAPHPLKWAPSSCSKHEHILWRQPAPGPCTPRKALTLTR